MADPTPSAPDAPRCPFCGEVFPGEDECPAHGLPLEVPAAPPTADPVDDAPLALHDPRAGRGWVAVAGVAFVLALGLPFVRTGPEGALVASGMQVALARAPHLWAIPLVGLWLVSVLRRRRTPRRLRGARVAVPILGLLAAVAAGSTLWGIRRGARLAEAQLGVDVPAEPLVGFWLVAAGVVATGVAAFRLGAAPDRRG